MDTLGQRIRKRRKALKLTQKQLGDSVKVSHVTVSQWEQDLFAPKNINGLSKALKCQPSYLEKGFPVPGEEDDNQVKESNAVWEGDIEPWDSSTPLADDEVELPFFTEVELAAGDGSTQVQENQGCKLRFAKSTLRRTNVAPANAACVKVKGNSMEPVLPEGSTIGIDTASKSIVDGKMFAIDHDGMLRVKRLYRIPGGGIRLRSYNDEEYPDEMYKGDDMKQIKIIGKVFWYSALV